MSYFSRHIFFCCNQRPAGEMCCNQHNAQAMRDYMKAQIKALGEKIPGKVRVNTAGCLDRCAQGPVMVIYPDAVWYTYANTADVEEIIQSHLIQGKPVERLRV